VSHVNDDVSRIVAFFGGCRSVSFAGIRAPFLLPAASAAGQSTVELAGGLKAEVTSFGRARDTLNVAVRLPARPKDKNTAVILPFGEPSAFNDGGGKYTRRNVSGVAWC
jgi:hypothetical protein